MQKKWIFPPKVDPKLVASLAEELQLPGPLASLLIARGFTTVSEASSFLHPRLANLRAPEEIPGIPAAVKRLHQALEKKEKILLYGDYDVDGISSLALLCRLLRALGGSIECFIPERAAEGYGLSQAGVERCLSSFQPDLIVAIDCGTNSLKEAQYIRERGIDLIIVDHHELAPTNAASGCVALVNPQLGSDYHYLCSVGLVFKLAHALLKSDPEPSIDLRHYLDLVALGTVADIVPLIEENRIFVFHGLRQLEKSRWPGVQALIEVADVKSPYTAMDIGFKLGPRINAAGRLSSALESLELLLTDDPAEALRLAHALDLRNRERQAVERAVTLEAEELVTTQFLTTLPKSIVLGCPHWHPGVVGIVASRISRRWHRPTLIIGFDEEGLGKGSGRSIEGFSLVTALQESSHLLETFGGHAMAAGLTVLETRLEELQTTFEKTAGSLLSEEDLIPLLKLDAEVPLADLNDVWLAAQDLLGPFGIANPQPLFLARCVKPAKEPRVLKEKHLRLEFLGARGALLTAIFFNGARDLLPKAPWDLAFTLERNTYQGRTSLQMQVVAVRECS